MELLEHALLGERLYRDVLPNGLPIYILPRPTYGRQFALFAVRFGGMDLHLPGGEGAGHGIPAGAAHFMEHKMFDTEDGSGLEILGANGAAENAFTASSMTAYYFESTHGFEDNLRALLSFVSVPYFTEESVEKERGIVEQEIAMSEDEPESVVYQQLLRCMYQNHPIRVPVLGTEGSVGQLTPELLYRCHEAFYTPGNMVLCVAGNVDPEQVSGLARRVLSSNTGSEVCSETIGLEPEGVFAAYSERYMEVSVPLFDIGFTGTPPRKGGALRQRRVGELACDVLFGPSAPLYTRLYEAGLINSSFDGLYDSAPGCAYLAVGGESRDPRRVMEELLAEADRLVREGVDEGLWDRLKRAAYGSMVRRLNSLEDICIELADSHFDGEDYFSFPLLFRSIEWSDVREMLSEWCVPKRTALSVIWPQIKDL